MHNLGLDLLSKFSLIKISPAPIVQRIRAKIALNVVKAYEAYNIKIKIRLGGILKIFCFCSQANMAAQTKAFH